MIIIYSLSSLRKAKLTKTFHKKKNTINSTPTPLYLTTRIANNIKTGLHFWLINVIYCSFHISFKSIYFHWQKAIWRPYHLYSVYRIPWRVQREPRRLPSDLKLKFRSHWKIDEFVLRTRIVNSLPCFIKYLIQSAFQYKVILIKWANHGKSNLLGTRNE